MQEPYAKPTVYPSTEISDALRDQIRNELPEIQRIEGLPLRDLTVEAWAYALASSTFSSIRQIPPAGMPGYQEVKHGDQTDHLRGVTRLALGIAKEMQAAYPDLEVDMDIVLSGALLHDVGKAWEFDPERCERWSDKQKRYGRPSIRHPAMGAHICLTVGLPEEVAHIAMAHSGEGELLVRSLECMIVHKADYVFWDVLLAGGKLKPETVPPSKRRYLKDAPPW